MSEETKNYYGFDENTGEGQILDMPAGINENVFIKELKFEKPKEESEQRAIIFIFANDKGEEFAHFEFAINHEALKTMAAEWGKPVAEVIGQQYAQQGARLKHICATFTKTDLSLKAASWDEFGEKFVEFVGNQYEGCRFRIKIIYNNKDRIQFPRRVIRPFIQNMEEDNILRISPKWDHVHPQSKPATEDDFSDDFAENETEEATPAKAKAEVVDEDDF